MRYIESINHALDGLCAERQDVYLIGEDLLDPYGGAFKAVKGLSTRYPDRVLTTPISEAGLTGVAIGMAMRGYRPIVEIMFGDFLMLCADQIVNHATKFSYMYNEQVQVPLTIRTPMGGYRGYGPTHSQTLEAMFLGVPRLTILAPSHYHDPGRLLAQSVAGCTDPVLFIENKTLYPKQLIAADGNGRSGHFHRREVEEDARGFPTVILSLAPDTVPDVTLITYGGMAEIAADAAYQALMREELVVEVVLPSRISPLPLDDIMQSVRRSGRAVILEEGVSTGGWGAEVGCQLHAALGQTGRLAFARVGAAPVPIPSAKSLERKILPSADSVLEAIMRLAATIH
jgi:pyruvate/2-oxoglutarate/acetoin dehydrogenase E1 component